MRSFMNLGWITVGLLCFGPAPFPARAEGPVAIVIPEGPEILQSQKKGHPRLLATAADFTRLKSEIQNVPLLQAWFGKLRDQADSILRQAPSRYEIPDGLRLLATSRRVLHRTYLLALLYRLENDPRYRERAWRELEAAGRFQDWNPRHFLDTAEMTHAFAIGYDWLYDDWTEAQRRFLREAMVEKGLRPALKVHREGRWWAKAVHNWNQVCNGGIGMGALALADVEPALAGEFLHDALQSIQLPMEQFAPDGAWKEGPGYWNYATFYNCVFLAGLDSALGKDFSLSTLTGFSQCGLFPIYMTGPVGRTFNYADAHDGPVRAPQMFWLARKFERSVYAEYEVKMAALDPLDLLWYRPPAAHAWPKLPLDVYFRGAEVAAFRSAWDDPNAVFLGLKAGDNRANHSHLDLGSFVLDAQGARWGLDLGSDDYNLPGYFGNKRWTYYRLRAEGHNTLVLNPGPGPDQNPKAAAAIVTFKSNPGRSLAVTDLSAAYAAHADRVWRGVALLDRSQVLVQDEIKAKKPADVWWFFHTRADPELTANGTKARLRQGSARLEAQILSPPGATFTIREAEPLPGTSHPPKQAENRGIKKLALHLPDQTDLRIAVLFTPLSEGKPAPEKSPALVNLAEW
jgi:Heparinase II/III-like protein